jgi:ABC-type multidrug transport system ATPase subunit
VNGGTPDKFYKRRSAYVAADTVHISTCTVLECLKFAAKLRMPNGTNKREMNEKVGLDVLLWVTLEIFFFFSLTKRLRQQR